MGTWTEQSECNIGKCYHLSANGRCNNEEACCMKGKLLDCPMTAAAVYMVDSHDPTSKPPFVEFLCDVEAMAEMERELYRLKATLADLEDMLE